MLKRYINLLFVLTLTAMSCAVAALAGYAMVLSVLEIVRLWGG